MNRRAALQMSIQSIIVFILAFIVMGALIGVVNTIITQIEVGVEQIPIEQASNPADRENPVTVQNGRLVIEQRERQKEATFSFYNQDWYVSQESTGCTANTAPSAGTLQICGWENLSFDISQCQPNPGTGLNSPEIQGVFLPDVNQELQPGDVVAMTGFINEYGFPEGSYSCALEVNANWPSGQTEVLARDQFVMEVR